MHSKRTDAKIPVIRFDHVTVNGDAGPLLRNVSFELMEGEKAVLAGPSGAGKTTLLHTVLGGHRASSGCVFFQGAAVTESSVQVLRRSTAYIAQEPVLGAEIAGDALMLPFTFRANRDCRPSGSSVEDALKMTGLSPDILTRAVENISGGEKQRIAAARALLLGRKIFLLDEVTSALDDENTRMLQGLFSRPEYTVLAVSHDARWTGIFLRKFHMEHGALKEVSA